MNENLDIFVYSHIPFKPLVKNPVYKVLTNTREPIDTKLQVYHDFEGDNISDMNLMYNEYTGLYWIWKNYELKDYVGLNHYRRYYDFLDNVPDFNQMFSIFDIILNEPLPLKIGQIGTSLNNRDWYNYWHNVEDFDKLESLIKNKYPEYTDGFEKMKSSEFTFPSSLFTMKKETFKEYCDFIFNVLKDYRKDNGLITVSDCVKHVENNKDKYLKPHLPYYTVEMQARIIGYIAERALQTFLMNGEHSLLNDAMYLKWNLYDCFNGTKVWEKK